MNTGKKAFVYIILFSVFIAQIAFSGTVHADSNNATERQLEATDNADNVSAYAIANETYLVTSTGNTSSASAMTAVNTSLMAGSAVTTEKLGLNVVYKDTLTANGQIIDELTQEKATGYFANRVISYCESRISVYEEPDSTSAVVGCMYSRSQAKVLEKGEEYSLIESGEVVGYVRNVYLLFGEEAERVAPFIGTKSTTVGDSDIYVYSAADESSDIVGTFYAEEEINAYDEVNGWVLVDGDFGFGYVKAEGVVEAYNLDYAMTIEAENEYLAELARIEAERLAAEREAQARAAAARTTYIAPTTNPAMSVDWSEEYLLACIIEWEAGWEPYEGKLAVANVVLNRVRSPRFAQNTITSVIYAPGQFSGVLDGNGNISERFGAVLANGPTHDECYSAAQQALSGVNNIGDYLFFISVKKANYARYTQYTILNNHCFYAY